MVERQLNCYCGFSSHFGPVALVSLVACLRFVFRVSCFAFLVSLWHLWQFVSRYAYAFLVSLWHFDDDQKLCKMVCKTVVQDGSCARCCERWCARCYARWLECVRCCARSFARWNVASSRWCDALEVDCGVDCMGVVTLLR